MNIHLIRHGKTIANEQKLYCGKTDLPLSDNGVEEILSIKGIYPQYVDLFFTSPLLRAVQTLEHIYGNVDNVSLSGMEEYHFGQFEMKSYEQLKNDAGYQAWITDGTGHIPCPGGESRQEFTHRVLRCYGLLIEEYLHVNSVVLISHGGVITTIMEHLFPSKHHFYEWQPKPGRGYTISYFSKDNCTYKKI
ncbi:MAG: histidine phosphatase family protein [Firmicutes bacterium]|nr:histidine phosphatase family protein [Bacillota bacterium]